MLKLTREEIEVMPKRDCLESSFICKEPGMPWHTVACRAHKCVAAIGG